MKTEIQYILKNKSTGQEITYSSIDGVIAWLEQNRRVTIHKTPELSDAVEALAEGIQEEFVTKESLSASAARLAELAKEWEDATEYTVCHEEGFFLASSLWSLVNKCGDWNLEEQNPLS